MVLALACTFAYADVYLLRPQEKHGDGANKTERGIEAETKNLWREPIFYNGVRINVDIAMLSAPIAEIRSGIIAAHPGATVIENTSCLLLETERNERIRKRILFIETGGDFPVLRFDAVLPTSTPEQPPPHLVRDQPVPPGASPLIHVRMPERDADLCIFSFAGQSSAAEALIRQRLVADGWRTVEQQVPNSGGMVFFRGSPVELIVVSLRETGNTETHGLIYRTRRKGSSGVFAGEHEH
jgi:hypothetical protein